MTGLVWRQSELGPADLGAGDAAAQLFEGRRQMRLEIFVREDLQNRVDARREGYDGPVQVRIRFQSLPSALIAKYFPKDFQSWFIRTETQDLNSEESERRQAEIKDLFSAQEFPVLIIEDFHSTGLNGPINSYIPVKDVDSPLYHSTNAFTCFFRRNGRSGKTDKSLGSAGLGRHVYYKASKISSKLVYTVPIDICREEGQSLLVQDPRPLFFGQSFQRELAERDGKRQRRYCPYHHLSGAAIDQIPMPFGLGDDSEIAEEARTDFRLERTPDEPGCSIVIPFPKSNFTPKALVNSIVRDFSMPILAGKLNVDVNGVNINASNIASLSDKSEVNEHNSFLSEAIHAKPDASVKVTEERLKCPFGDDLFSGPELKQIAQSFNDHALVCVRTDIQFGPRADQSGSFLICAQKTDGGKKGRHLVTRSGLVLSEYTDRNFQRASNASLVVQPDNLGGLLRSIENPAHSEWLPGDADPHRCACAKELVQFIRYAHSAFERLLANLDTEDDLNIFRDLLPTGPRRQPEPATTSPFDVSLDDDGQTFVLRPADVYNAASGTKWRFALIYDSVYGSGRARRGYRPGTFDLHTVPVDIAGGKVLDRGECHFDVSVVNPAKFRVSIGPCGFAGWADVRFHAELHTGNMGA